MTTPSYEKINSQVESLRLIHEQVIADVISMSDAFEHLSGTIEKFGKSVGKVVPTAGNAEVKMSGFIHNLSVQQVDLFTEMKKNMDDIRVVNGKYNYAKQTLDFAQSKLNSMSDKHDDSFRKRINLQTAKVVKLEVTLGKIEKECISELTRIKNAQVAYIQNNSVVLLEIQKNVMKQCIGSINTFRNGWNSGKRF